MPRVSSRSKTHRSLANTFIIEAGSPPPFQKIGELAGAAASAIATEHGVVAITANEIGLHTHDLSRQLWRMPVPHSTDVVYRDDKLFLGVDKHVVILDAASGDVNSRVPSATSQVGAVTPDGALVRAADHLALLDLDSGRQIWSRPYRSPYVASDDQAAYSRVELNDAVACVDLKTGDERWLFRAEPEGTSKRSHTVHDFGVFPEAVIVVTEFGRIFKLDRTTGRPIASAIPRVFGMPLVTQKGVFLFRHEALLEFRISDMTDGELTDLRSAAKVNKPFSASASYALSEHAIIWTTTSGMVRAVSRRDPSIIWQDDVSPALFSTAQPPIIWNEYVYVEPVAGPACLVAYRSIA